MQLSKYAPGNIFHLAGRQVIGQAAGLLAWPLAKSIAWKLGLIAVTGGLFGVLILPHFIPVLPVPWASVAFACVLFIVIAVLSNVVGKQAAYAVGWYAIFLTISGLIFVGLLILLTATNAVGPMQAVTIGGAFVVAWLAGVLTPGAPAGVGVRELVLLVLLRGMVAEADLLLAVVLGRIVTVTGDVLFFLSTFFMSKTDQVDLKRHCYTLNVRVLAFFFACAYVCIVSAWRSAVYGDANTSTGSVVYRFFPVVHE
ncbi:MAG: hypothetical protein ACXWT1_19195 [Methylobacter sp.]